MLSYPLSIKFEPELHEQIRRLAAAEGISQSEFIRQAVQTHVVTQVEQAWDLCDRRLHEVLKARGIFPEDDLESFARLDHAAHQLYSCFDHSAVKRAGDPGITNAQLFDALVDAVIRGWKSTEAG
jgi:hypothetical protein